jgi:heme-degrading monooxygenase HmoA
MQLELQAIIIVVAAVLATAFVPGPVAHRSRALHMNTGFFDEALVDKTLPKDAMVAQRYIATNRFKVRNNAGPKFEKRWAERKSRLADLEGFRFFNLMKRVDEFGADYTDDDGLGNYVSSTVWADKDCFDAWRTGGE